MMMQHNSEIDVRAAGPNMDHVLTHLEFLAKPNAGLSPEYKLEIRAIRERALHHAAISLTQRMTMG